MMPPLLLRLLSSIRGARALSLCRRTILPRGFFCFGRSELGVRPIRGQSKIGPHDQGAKGDHHARSVPTLDDNSRHAALAGAVISVSLTGTSAQAPATDAENGLGRTRSTGHLDRRNRHAPAALAQVREPRIFHRSRARRFGSAAIGLTTATSARSAGPRPTSPAPTMTCSRPRSVPAQRTSRIVDPPNGRLPPLTPEAQKIAAAERAFRVALLQATETCKNNESACNGGKYDPTHSPRFADLPPRYNTATHQSPLWSGGRLLGGALPDGWAARDRHAWRDRRPHQLPADRADTRRHLDLLRRGSGSRLAAQYRHGRKPPSARQYSPVVWRLAWPLGGQYARHRRDEFQFEDRFSGLAREFASGRALDANRPNHRSNMP